MIQLCYSNATEELLQQLVGALRAERAAGQSALQPVRLVVPNRNVEAYVKLGLAEATGISANLEVTFLRRFLARVAERAWPRARVVGAEQLEGHLLHLLHDDARLGAAELAPVREYLQAAGESPDAVDRRRGQLAAELARLFDEYASSRPKMLAEWRAGAAPSGRPAPAAAESWQRALWREIFGPRGLVAERSAREEITWMPLAELLAAAEGRIDVGALGQRLHLFGVSYMAESYHRMLALLGKQLDVRIYTLNPCREFWEDLETTGETARRAKRGARGKLFPTRGEGRQARLGLGDDPFDLESDEEMLALRLWGRPGRENIRLLNQLTDADFDGRFRPNVHPNVHPNAGTGAGGAASLLHRLQDDILDRTARTSPDPPVTSDGSITVLPCPGLRRELEVVAAEIWRMIDADPGLRFNQIAVIVPESRKAAYLSQIGAVFGESHDLPHSAIDLPLGEAHGLGEAIEMLLELPLGAFSRRELLPLITHPAILSPARFPDASPTAWVRLVDELGIVHGADRQDHRDTYIARDLFNWDQGLRRIVLGALMTGPRGGDDAPVLFGDRPYLPAEPPPGESSGALGFALLVRSLIEDARLAAGIGGPRARPLAEWLDFIRGLLTGYLCPADDAEAALLGRCLAALAELEEIGLDGPAAPPVSYRVASELYRRRLAGLSGERGQHLARGVAVASFVPMRAIPFRAVFLVGLGHGDFPAPPRRSDLDLRAGQRLAGDVSPREQDLYMFLETLLCARERLVLSYVARDELTGEGLEPSSVILELREILTRGYLAPAEAAKLFEAEERIPLRRYDDQPRLDAHPLALRERRARALGQSLAAALPPGMAAPDLRSLERLMPTGSYRELAASLGLHPPPMAATMATTTASTTPLDAAAGAAKVVVSLQALLQFLEDPLQGSARFRLHMRELDSEDEVVDREDEPFEMQRGQRTRLLRQVMLAALGQPSGGSAARPAWATVLQAYDRLAEREELLGRLSTGAFRAAERPGDQAILQTWWNEALEVGGGGEAPRGRIFRFGRAAELDAADEIRDPIVLELAQSGDGGAPPLRVEIVGRTELIVDVGHGRVDVNVDGGAGARDGAAPGKTGSLVFSCRNSGHEAKADRELLRAFIDHVALAAAGLPAGTHAALLAVADGQGGGGGGLERRLMAPLDGARARQYLASLVGELLTGQTDAASGAPTGLHPYLLPYEAIFKAHRLGATLTEAIEDLREGYIERPASSFSSVWGPVPQAVERHGPPPAEAADAMMRSRFGLLFELLLDQPEAP